MSAKVGDDFQMQKEQGAPALRQASKDEQELFNDPTDKYKLVMKGEVHSASDAVPAWS